MIEVKKMLDLIYVSMTCLFESFFFIFLHDEKNMKLYTFRAVGVLVAFLNELKQKRGLCRSRASSWQLYTHPEHLGALVICFKACL